jgi:hypothetical protein
LIAAELADVEAVLVERAGVRPEDTFAAERRDVDLERGILKYAGRRMEDERGDHRPYVRHLAAAAKDHEGLVGARSRMGAEVDETKGPRGEECVTPGMGGARLERATSCL